MVCTRGVIPKEILEIGARAEGAEQADAAAISAHLSEAVGSATCSCCNLHCEEHLAKMLGIVRQKERGKGTVVNGGMEEKDGASTSSSSSRGRRSGSNVEQKKATVQTKLADDQVAWHANVQVALEDAFYSWYKIKEYRSKLEKVKAEKYILQFEAKLSDAREDLDSALASLLEQKLVFTPPAHDEEGNSVAGEGSNSITIKDEQGASQDGKDPLPTSPPADAVIAAIGLIDVLLHVANEASPGGGIYEESGGVEQLLDQTVLDALSSDILREFHFAECTRALLCVWWWCRSLFAFAALPDLETNAARPRFVLDKVTSRPMETQGRVEWQKILDYKERQSQDRGLQRPKERTNHGFRVRRRSRRRVRGREDFERRKVTSGKISQQQKLVKPYIQTCCHHSAASLLPLRFHHMRTAPEKTRPPPRPAALPLDTTRPPPTA